MESFTPFQFLYFHLIYLLLIDEIVKRLFSLDDSNLVETLFANLKSQFDFANYKKQVLQKKKISVCCFR